MSVQLWVFVIFLLLLLFKLRIIFELILWTVVEVNQTAFAELGFGLSVVSFSGEVMGQDRKSVDE